MDTERMATDPPTAEGAVVKVRRQPQDWRLADYRLSDVSDLRWSKTSGGTRRKYQLHVYGYVMCDAMLTGKIAHSCRHGPPPHMVKVCITKKYNEGIWSLILEKVGSKPKQRRRKARRGKGRPKANVLHQRPPTEAAA
jgi:hypothetical protein